MAYDYALVHLKFTIPLAGLLTLLAYPLLTRRHWYQTSILITIAVVATIPWDSYLIRHNVWTYPPDAIVGPTLFSIPAEELFFFVVQTYITSLLYHLLNKPLLHAEYLLPPPPSPSRRLFPFSARTATYRTVQAALLGLVLLGARLVAAGGRGTYMGLILVWAGPFALLTWTLGGVFMTALPWTSTAWPVAAATLYLWAVDEGALRRGTWAIASGTKLGATVAGSLEVEEAVFFLATNLLIVFGLGAFDNALAVVDAFPDAFASAPECPSPAALVRALLVPWTAERRARVVAIQEAVERLYRKSRSFYLASSTFMGRLRIDLVLLYSYCRMADDLVDEPPEGLDPSVWIQRLTEHLDLVYKPSNKKEITPAQREDIVRTYIATSFPASARSALTYLPTSLLPSEPLYLLLEGFKTDSKFGTPSSSHPSSNPTNNKNDINNTNNNPPNPKPPQNQTKTHWPITDEPALRAYGAQVAGTVGELCLSLISHHARAPITPPSRRAEIAAAAGRMGVALQYVNIARDVGVDTAMGRVYLPRTWLAEARGGGLSPEDVVALFSGGSSSSLSGEREGSSSSPTTTTTTGAAARQREQRDGRGGKVTGNENDDEEEEEEEKEDINKARRQAIAKIRKDKLLRRAFGIYEEARPVMDLLPEEARRPMVVAVESYMEIGRVLLEQEDDEDPLVGGVVPGQRPTRATVPRMRRLKVALRALLFA